MKLDKPIFNDLVILLRGHGYNSNNLSIIMDHSRPTIQKRMQTPGDFTLFDIADILHDGEITFDQFVEAIRKDMP